MLFWQARVFKATVAILATVAWFTGTHHCLLRSIKDSHCAITQACPCSEHGKGSGAQNESRSLMLGCCQGLLSSGSELAQEKVKFSRVLFGLQLIAIDRFIGFEDLQLPTLGAVYETGPPGESYFITTVLRRCLRENAPPFLV